MADLRRTKIICTLGPAVDSEEQIRALILDGMNAARFNFSHDSYREHERRINWLKAQRKKTDRPIASILDTRGPEIRIRSFAVGRVTLQEGASFALTTREVEGDEHMVSVTYPNLHREVPVGQEILIDDGLISLRVESVEGQEIRCRVEHGGPLSANKSINIPGVHIRLPALTEKDVADLRFGVEHGFDYIAASFVRRAEDVEEIRGLLRKLGGEAIKIIAKIENQEGVDNLDAILAVADGIMVARGDLGVEVPAERVPFLQKQMIRKGLQAGKPVITATQMLDSMMHHPRPTRAEVSDVANAVFDGTSCVMLSGETAGGKYPIQALCTMRDIVMETERSIHYWRHLQKQRIHSQGGINDAISHACCRTAMELDAAAIVAATHSGHTPRMIARFRPSCPVVAMTGQEPVYRQLAICWGVVPVLAEEADSTDGMFIRAGEAARKKKLAVTGDVVVITAGVPLGKSGTTNLLKVQTIGEDRSKSTR